MSQPFRRAFTREAKLDQNKRDLVVAYYRNVDDPRRVVSRRLAQLTGKWDNAIDPKNSDGFNLCVVDDDTGHTMFKPEDSTQWEIEHTEIEHTPDMFDHKAYNQLLGKVREMNYYDAKTLADFLHGTFTASYVFEGEFSNGRTEQCTQCNGTGRYCDADDCISYCTNEKCGSGDELLYVSDEECNCTTCNYEDHWVECENCDGEGELAKTSFTRTFPYSKDLVMETTPTRGQLQVIQFALNKLSKHYEDSPSIPSLSGILGLYDAIENRSKEALINRALNLIEETMNDEMTDESDDGTQVFTISVENPDDVLADAQQEMAVLAEDTTDYEFNSRQTQVSINV